MTNLCSDEALELKTLDDFLGSCTDPAGFKYRFEFFKSHLKRKYPHLSTQDLLFLYRNQEAVRDIFKWDGFHRLMQALEFEHYKSLPFKVPLDEI